MHGEIGTELDRLPTVIWTNTQVYSKTVKNMGTAEKQHKWVSMKENGMEKSRAKGFISGMMERGWKGFLKERCAWF